MTVELDRIGDQLLALAANMRELADLFGAERPAPDVFHLLWSHHHEWQIGPGHLAATSIERVNCRQCLAGHAAARGGAR